MMNTFRNRHPFLKRAVLAASLALPGALVSNPSIADEVTGLTTFTAGTPARASEVNGNFNAVKSAVDDNFSRLNAIQSTVTALGDRVTALESDGTLGALLYGDGSAGDLVVSGTLLWNTETAPENLNFNNCTIQSGAILNVEGGLTIRCAGSLTVEGAILVLPSQRAGYIGTPTAAVRGPRMGFPAPGDFSEIPGFPEYDTDGTFSDTLDGGDAARGVFRIQVLNALRVMHKGGSAGGGAAGAGGGAGGGFLKILAGGAVTITGSLRADGNPGAGGGAGGTIIVGSRTSITNSGTIAARGGVGTSSTATYGASGGGGGGIVVLVAPSVTSGTIQVNGGLGGGTSTAVSSVAYRSGGGGGGGNGGAGGAGGNVTGAVSTAGGAGSPGYAIVLQNDPLYLLL